METVFDHNITDKERIAIYGSTRLDRDFFESRSQEENYKNIVNLYIYRKDNDKAAEYAKKLPDDVYKWFTLLNHDFC